MYGVSRSRPDQPNAGPAARRAPRSASPSRRRGPGARVSGPLFRLDISSPICILHLYSPCKPRRREATDGNGDRTDEEGYPRRGERERAVRLVRRRVGVRGPRIRRGGERRGARGPEDVVRAAERGDQSGASRVRRERRGGEGARRHVGRRDRGGAGGRDQGRRERPPRDRERDRPEVALSPAPSVLYSPRYAARTCGSASSSAPVPSSTTLPSSRTRARGPSRSDGGTFCSTSKIVVPAAWISRSARTTACTNTGD